MKRYRSALAPLLLLAAVSWTGCDAIAEKLGIDKVNVPLGSIGSNLAVSTTTASIKTGSITRDGGNLPKVFTVKSIAIDAADLTFAASGAGKVAQSGSVRAGVIISGCAALLVDVTVANNIVTNVAPVPVQVGQINMTNFQAMLAKLPAATRPTVTAACTPAGLAAELTKSTFSGSVVAAVFSGDLNGTFGIKEGTFNLDF